TAMDTVVADTTSTSPVANIAEPLPSGKTITDKDVVFFVQKASSVGMMEIELGNYATQNGQNQRVKDFGAMLVNDHAKAANDLKAIATSNSITVPASMLKEEQEHVDMLKKKSGAAFDKDYIDMMAQGHKKTIEMFKKASADLSEDAYKAFATMTLPVLQKHLDSAQAIRKGL
ncbi:MAG: DUF4142 domain-containing protein, partial [Ferruginibacter sp.]